MRERLNEMGPDERMRFERNLERWRQMSPEEQKWMRERETLRHERIKREADEALRTSGLNLDQTRRDQFEQRYMQERRKIEQALHQEIEDKRQQQLTPMIERLKREFQNQSASPAPSLSAAPAGSASPGKQ